MVGLTKLAGLLAIAALPLASATSWSSTKDSWPETSSDQSSTRSWDKDSGDNTVTIDTAGGNWKTSTTGGTWKTTTTSEAWNTAAAVSSPNDTGNANANAGTAGSTVTIDLGSAPTARTTSNSNSSGGGLLLQGPPSNNTLPTITILLGSGRTNGTGSVATGSAAAGSGASFSLTRGTTTGSAAAAQVTTNAASPLHKADMAGSFLAVFGIALVLA